MREKNCPCCGPTVLMDFQKIGRYYKWICKTCGNEILCYEDGSPLSEEDYKKFIKEAENWS